MEIVSGHVSSNFWLEALPGRRAVYIRFNHVQNSSDESIAAFAARLDREPQSAHPRLLGIDVRYNGGGDADLLPPLVRVIRDFEAREPKAKVVVLIGPCTFSAGQIFISILNRDSKAIFAGEPSGSKPNFVGEHNPVELPWSGVIVNISNRRHEIIPGDKREWIEPDVKVELSSGDYFANRDPPAGESNMVTPGARRVLSSWKPLPGNLVARSNRNTSAPWLRLLFAT